MELRVAARNLPKVYRRRRTGRRLSITFENAGRCVELRGAMVQVGDEVEGCQLSPSISIDDVNTNSGPSAMYHF